MSKFLSNFEVVKFSVVIFCVKKYCFILHQKLVTFCVKTLLHFGSIVVTSRVNVTLCVIGCYILR